MINKVLKNWLPKGISEILSNLFSEVNFRMETPEPTLNIKKDNENH